MTASKDNTSGDFDLPAFKPKAVKPKSASAPEGGASASEGERKPRAYRSSRPAYGEGGKDAPARKPYTPSAAPREDGPRTLKGSFPSKPAWANRDPAAVENPRPNEFRNRDPNAERPSRAFGDKPS